MAPGIAQAVRPICSSLYASLYRDTRAGAYITEDDKAKIQAINESTQYDSRKKAQLVFNQVLDARLRNADPAVAAHVNKVREQVTRTIGADINGEYSIITRHAEVIVPDYLAESSVEYMVKIHELEHAYQDKFLRSHGRLFLEFGTKKKMLLESDAMALEWNYIRQIPVKEREKLIELIQADTKMTGGKLSLIAALKNADHSFQQFVDGERALGRYDNVSIAAENKVMVELVGGIIAAWIIGRYHPIHIIKPAN